MGPREGVAIKRRSKNEVDKPSGKVTLATLARRLDLTTGTVSSVLTNGRGSKSIPQKTKDRVLAVAAELKYQPNFFARSLRKKRSYTVGVIAPDIGNKHIAQVMAGFEHFLCERGYFFILGVHGNNPDLLQKRSNAMLQRGIEGLIIVDQDPPKSLPVPAVVLAFPQPLETSNLRRPNGAIITSDFRQEFESVGKNAAASLLQLIDGNSSSELPAFTDGDDHASPTITDIARFAGVSIATVSYALNGSAPVSAETAAAIQRIANELGYKPNSHAVKLGQLGNGRSRQAKLENDGALLPPKEHTGPDPVNDIRSVTME